MAGSDQSANLGGMLSQIGGALGRGVDVSGLGANIVNMSRPELDMNDPASLQRYAQWSTGVGNKEEGLQYGQLAAKLKREQDTLSAAKAASGISQMGGASAQQGDVRGVQTAIKKIDGLIGQATTAEQYNALQEQRKALASQLQGANEVSMTNQVAGMTKIEQMLEGDGKYVGADGKSYTLQTEQRRQLEQTLEQMKTDPNLYNGWAQQSLKRSEMQDVQEARAEEAYIKGQSAAITAAAGDPERLRKLVANAPSQFQNGVRQYAYEVAQVESTFAAIDEKNAENNRAADITLANELYATLPAAMQEQLAPLQAAAEDALAVNVEGSNPAARQAVGAFEKAMRDFSRTVVETNYRNSATEVASNKAVLKKARLALNAPVTAEHRIEVATMLAELNEDDLADDPQVYLAQAEELIASERELSYNAFAREYDPNWVEPESAPAEEEQDETVPLQRGDTREDDEGKIYKYTGGDPMNKSSWKVVPTWTDEQKAMIVGAPVEQLSFDWLKGYRQRPDMPQNYINLDTRLPTGVDPRTRDADRRTLEAIRNRQQG